MIHLAAERLISGAGGGAMILPDGAGAFAAGAALAAGFFAGAFACRASAFAQPSTGPCSWPPGHCVQSAPLVKGCGLESPLAPQMLVREVLGRYQLWSWSCRVHRKACLLRRLFKIAVLAIIIHAHVIPVRVQLDGLLLLLGRLLCLHACFSGHPSA